MEKLIIAMEEFLTEQGYVKEKGEGLGGLWKVPKRGHFTGNVMFLKRCVDFEFDYMAECRKINPAYI